MTDTISKHSDDRLTDVRSLARSVDLPPDQVRAAMRIFMQRIADRDADLSSALVQASATSGVEPSAIIAMIEAMASDFDRPLDHAPETVKERLNELGQSLTGHAERLYTDAKDRLGHVDLDGVKQQVSDIADTGRSLGSRAIESAGDFAKDVSKRFSKH